MTAKHPIRFILMLLAWLPALAGGASPRVHHELEVRLDPEAGTLAVRDRLSLPEGMEQTLLVLHAGLSPRVPDGTGQVFSLGRAGDMERFLVRPRSGSDPVTLAYGGRIHHALQDLAESPGRSREHSRGLIDPRGVFLDGASGWYPWIEGTLQSFRLEVGLPEGWLAVSQGDGPTIGSAEGRVRVGWSEAQPQDDIYLIAAPFELYRQDTPRAEAQVWLRAPDPDLAGRYLEATARYLDLYARLLGDYPYAKFALVENFWDTGFGMPSFTLLGPRVIRLPFIVHTSYPHEVLHNWWGNGVYVDYDGGNWSEGLTSYLADHLLKEERGQGEEHRRDALSRYADYVREGRDFPLRGFRSRHGAASQSVGYDKGLMLFHMLRRELGDAAFLAGLRRFYADNRFRVAGFADLERAFAAASDRDLSGFFAQWLERTGAPALALADVTVESSVDGYRVRGRIAQTQSDDPFRLGVPLLLHQEGGAPVETRVTLNGREAPFEIQAPGRPLRLDLDPRYDLFRTLAPGETPFGLSALFGAERVLILLPADAPAGLRAAYRGLAEAWAGGSPGWEVRDDADLSELPGDRPVWLLGRENRFLDRVRERLPPGTTLAEAGVAEFPDGSTSGPGDSVTLVTPAGDAPLGWVAAPGPQAVPGLARKLPHYGKYGYLVFGGDEPANRVKGQWPVGGSPLRVPFADPVPPIEIPPGPALTKTIGE